MKDKTVGILAIGGATAFMAACLGAAVVKGPENIERNISANCDEYCGPKSTYIVPLQGDKGFQVISTTDAFKTMAENDQIRALISQVAAGSLQNLSKNDEIGRLIATMPQPKY